MSLTRPLVVLATLFSLALPTTALAADELGSRGSLEVVEINHSTADTYVQYHGRVVIRTGKKTQEYRWGGTSCANKGLPENLVAALLDAFSNRKVTQVTPRFKDGAGSTRCLVGFSVEDRPKKGDDDDDHDGPKPPTVD